MARKNQVCEVRFFPGMRVALSYSAFESTGHRDLLLTQKIPSSFYSHSVFDGKQIPYPKREFLTDDDNDDKSDTSKVSNNARFDSSSCKYNIATAFYFA